MLNIMDNKISIKNPSNVMKTPLCNETESQGCL